MKAPSFAFGRNWHHFVNHYLNSELLHEAKKSLIDFIGEDHIRGKSFIDVGCGSGLFSLAAYQLGASKVVSFDIDGDSVRCCEYLKDREGNPGNWEVRVGSILDERFISKIGTYDIVYSWGVLHHTGKMWEAIENATRFVAKNGLLYIAIYNKVDHFGFYPDGRFGPSSLWEKEKRIYASLPSLIQNLIDYIVMLIMIILYILTLNNPIDKIRSHKNFRGMSWRVDIKDWLGGFPYEYATVAEVFLFVKRLGFSLENLKSNNGLLNNEYLFKKG
ncbi:MAG: class I SAM-dependent methyltransferase [bacterium]